LLKNGDFIKLAYDGYDDKGNIFDSTHGEVGKTLHGKDGPLLIVIGKHRLIQGLDETIRTMKKGEEKEASFGHEKAFGPRSKNLIRVMSSSDFRHHNVVPEPGITIHLDGDNGRVYGIVKSVSGGRVMVDFNHPMASKKVRYKVKLVDAIEGIEGRVQALMDELSLTGKITVTTNNGEVSITLDKKGEQFELRKSMFLAMAKEFIPDIKKIEVKESA